MENLLLSLINSSSSSSSSSSSEEDDIDVIRRNKVPRVTCFMDVIREYNAKEFKENFRVSRTQFETIRTLIASHLIRLEGSKGRFLIDIDLQLLSVLWLLATPDSYRSVGSRFNLGKSSLFSCFYRVVKALNCISKEIIKWPNLNERQMLKLKFFELAHLSGVIGAVDGTYIPIKAPQVDPEVYINRKCFHGITLQAICTNELKFMDCFTGFPSSVSDCRIFRNSDIYQRIQANRNHFFNEDEHIIGDKAYPVLNWCIPPFIDRGNLNNAERRFNHIHAKTRQVIERSFGLLFGRFRRLQYLDMNRTDLISCTIIAACVLHNVCLDKDDEDIETYINEGIIGIQINNEAQEVNENPGPLREAELGRIKRQYLVNLLTENLHN